MLELIQLYPDSLAVAGLVAALVLALSQSREEVCRVRPRTRTRVHRLHRRGRCAAGCPRASRRTTARRIDS